MIRKLLCLVLLAAMVTSCNQCPPPQTGPTKADPYTTARLVIQGAQLSLFVADGVFEGWIATQTDPVKIKEARAKYMKIRTAVADGLKLALDGVDIAQQAATDPDLTKLLAKADVAWQDLKTLLTDLIGKKVAPASLPAKVAPDKYKTFTVEDLPPTLLPIKKAK